LTEDFVIDYTPELKEQALVILNGYRVGGLYVPPLPEEHENDYINNIGCIGGVNISHQPVADPSTGLMFAAHSRNCFAPRFLRATNGVDRDNPNYPVPGEGGATPNSTPTTGTTVAAYLPGRSGGGLPTIDGLRLFKPMDNRLTAYQMNSGDKTWSMAVGPTPDSIKNHRLLEGVDVPETGGVGWSIQMVVDDLLVQTRAMSDGMAQLLPDAPLTLNARDKFTGEIVGSVALPAPGQYGMMTYMHQGKQYIVVQIGSTRTDFPGGLVAYRLPD
jgi:quinoprotein glucose dehydrogenase